MWLHVHIPPSAFADLLLGLRPVGGEWGPPRVPTYPLTERQATAVNRFEAFLRARRVPAPCPPGVRHHTIDLTWRWEGVDAAATVAWHSTTHAGFVVLHTTVWVGDRRLNYHTEFPP